MTLFLVVSTYAQSGASKKTSKNARQIEKLTKQMDKEQKKLKGYEADLEQERKALASANNDASGAANRARKFSRKMDRNPGNERLARKAEKAVDKTARNNEKSVKLTRKLNATQSNISKSNRRIADLQKKLDKLNAEG
ncbi:hypothetical protein A8C56_03575 [Niabella ginsenosidivorans]|uniref:Uncharacterized protein n=2 Tax=Niabella ginsenosidivorans TaxID=1176587 RepID=A0A1A9I0C3_9BACT|nr:hypothetical protein A8C56_03575 [Niabella ginsenosidivorans]